MKYRDDLLHMELLFRFSISFSKTEDFFSETILQLSLSGSRLAK